MAVEATLIWLAGNRLSNSLPSLAISLSTSKEWEALIIVKVSKAL
jgi:hypothetical protein